MRTLIIRSGVTVCQVECPAGIERSREGSLHIRPGATIVITDDELTYLRKVRPDLMDRATLVDEAKPSPKPTSKDAAPVSSGSETPKDEPEAPEDDKSKAGGKESKSKSKDKGKSTSKDK